MTEARHPTTTDLLERSNTTERERYRILRSDRRRAVLRVLSEADSEFDLGALAERVAAGETTGERPTAETVRRVEISLHHNHLPRLADHGVLTYDAEANRIVPR